MTPRTTVRLLAAAALTTLAAAAFAHEARPLSKNLIPADGRTIVQIAKLRKETNHWRTTMGQNAIGHEHGRRELASAGREYRRWVRELWRKRARAARTRAQNPPRHRAWLCIHRHERDPRQGWRTNTGNGYYGGLQMDRDFQRTYGPRLYRTKGTANNWTPLEQIWVAHKAYASGRGFHPWPNTARMCGLL